MSNNYRAEIDGLRALSIIGVVGFYTYPVIFSGGFFRRRYFFVISGYLISENIYKNLQESKFSFVDFYCRRIRRIFPSLIVMLLACLIVGHFASLK